MNTRVDMKNTYTVIGGLHFIRLKCHSFAAFNACVNKHLHHVVIKISKKYFFPPAWLLMASTVIRTRESQNLRASLTIRWRRNREKW
jgi:hypothetical protein